MGRQDPFLEERDACGVGFVADAEGRASRSIIDAALEALCRVRHRGAESSDARTGDGAGVLLPLPAALIDPHAAEGTQAGVAVAFLDPLDPAPGRAVLERASASHGLEVVDWRVVPVDPEALGDRARAAAPLIEQAIVRARGIDRDEAEGRAFRARRSAEQQAAELGVGLYLPSFSFRTIVYKALCAADQLAAFYADLSDRSFEAWFAIFHQRYSTNTSPSWERAQPFRMLAHNGEVNTIRGNVAWMRARERTIAAELGEKNLALNIATSDSGVLDQALELLVRGGRGLDHSAAMLVPPAWEQESGIDPAVQAFFEYHACLMEPWDGPAALVISDGDSVGALLDRNGLRPLRVAVCEDGLVACASEAGAVVTTGHGRVTRRKLGPGQTVMIDPVGGIVWDGAIKQKLALRRPYRVWVEGNLEACDSGRTVVPDDLDGNLVARQVASGYGKEEFTVVIRPMATEGAEPTSSMGDDTPQPPLAQHVRGVFSFLKQRFAQVTNPPVDHLRERHVMSISTRLGPRTSLLHESPRSARLRSYETFLLYPAGVRDLETAGGVVLDATFSQSDGPLGLRRACERLGREAVAHAGTDLTALIVSDRAAGPGRVAVPSALAAGAVHHALLAAGTRLRTGIVVECDDARETHHVACLLTNGADMVCPRLALMSIVELSVSGRLGGEVSPGDAQTRFMSALEDGVLKVMSKMGISTLDSYRGAQIIEAMGLAYEVIDVCFSGVASLMGGLGWSELGEDALARHQAAYTAKPVLANPGTIKFKKGGEYHGFNPDVVAGLQQAAGFDKEARDKEARDKEARDVDARDMAAGA